MPVQCDTFGEATECGSAERARDPEQRVRDIWPLDPSDLDIGPVDVRT